MKKISNQIENNELFKKIESILLIKGISNDKISVIIESIKKCETQQDLRNNYWKNYLILKRSNAWDVTTKILPKLDKKSYSDQEVIDNCNLANNLTELRTKFVNFYVIACRRKLQSKIPVFKNLRDDSHTTSLGEETIRLFLSTVFEKSFDKCRPDWLLGLKNRNLELDGYCEELSIAFEHQGDHHYRDTGRSLLAEVQERDLLKSKLCQENGVKLIVIPDIVEHFRLNEDDIKKRMIEEFYRLNIKIPSLFYITPIQIVIPDSNCWNYESILLQFLKDKSYSNFKNSGAAFAAFNRLGFKDKIENTFSANSIISSEQLVLSMLGSMDQSISFINKHNISNEKILLDFKEKNYSNNFNFIREDLNKRGEYFDNSNKRVKTDIVNEFIISGEIPVFNRFGIRIENPISINKSDLDEKIISSIDDNSIIEIFPNIEFSKAEKRVIFHLKDGGSNLDISRKLNISENAVKYQLTNIYKKAGVKNRGHFLGKIKSNEKSNQMIVIDEIKISELTDKEKEIVKSVRFDLSNSDLAILNNLTEKTLKFHLTNILKKLNCKNKIELISYLYE